MFLIIIFLFSNSYAQVIKIPADSESGFFWPYYLSIPASVGNSSTLLVIPNNTGTGDDDPAVHDSQAYLDAVKWTDFAGEIKSPLLIPTFPRPYTEWWIYTHALDRDSLLTDITELERIDLQLVAMIDDAKDRLSSMGTYIEKKVLMMGFSASAQFTSRFSIIHPNRIKAAAIGAPGYPIVPTSSWQGETLRYHVGTADLLDLTGEEFDLFSFKLIPLYFFVGGIDTNDPVDYTDGFDLQDQNIVNTLFGDTVIGRWPKIQEVYDTVGCNSDFVIYPGVGHSFTSQMVNDVEAFLKLNKIFEPDISINPLSHNFYNVNVGSFSEKVFTVSNDGNAILHVTGTNIMGDTSQIHITAGGGSFSLGLGSSRNITVKFAPTSSGIKSAILRIISNDSDHPQFDVNLTGIGKGSIGSVLQLLLLDGLP